MPYISHSAAPRLHQSCRRRREREINRKKVRGRAERNICTSQRCRSAPLGVGSLDGECHVISLLLFTLFWGGFLRWSLSIEGIFLEMIEIFKTNGTELGLEGLTLRHLISPFFTLGSTMPTYFSNFMALEDLQRAINHSQLGSLQY